MRKLGDIASAAKVIDTCRSLDLQDRYLNNKATKYLLRADEVTQAMDTIAMFTKHDGDPQYTLFELQVSWYELELADSYTRQKKYGLALKNFYAVQKHFAIYDDDQFDFHGYCMRKTTLRAYIDLLNMEDNLYAHKFYQRALRGAVSIMLSLEDRKAGASDGAADNDQDGADLSHLPPAERKKEKARLRKLRKKQEEQEEAKRLALEAEAKEKAKEKGEGRGGNIVAPKDEDPKGEKLIEKATLDEAASWCSRVQRLRGCHSDTHAVIADVMIRRQKYVAALKNVVSGLSKTPNHPECTTMLVKLAIAFSSSSTDNPLVHSIVDAELRDVMGGNIDVNRFVMEYVEKSKSLGLMHRIGAAKSLAMIGGDFFLFVTTPILCSPTNLICLIFHTSSKVMRVSF